MSCIYIVDENHSMKVKIRDDGLEHSKKGLFCTLNDGGGMIATCMA